jgi:glucose dehydrogenase
MTQRGLFLTTVVLMVGALAASPSAQAPSGSTAPFVPVSADRLLNAEDEPNNWLMYSGNYKSQRYSGLDQIDRANAAGLEIQWVHQLSTLDQAETTPIVVDGVMYITESPSTVIAVEAATGRPFWRYEHPLPDDMVFCCGRNNRGVAVQGDHIIMSTLDAHLTRRPAA